jgi:hypothetical protein
MRDRDLINLEEAYSQVIEEKWGGKILAGLAAAAHLATAQAQPSENPEEPNPHKEGEIAQQFAKPTPTPDKTLSSPIYIAQQALAAIGNGKESSEDPKIWEKIAGDAEFTKEFLNSRVGKPIPEIFKQKQPQVVREIEAARNSENLN